MSAANFHAVLGSIGESSAPPALPNLIGDTTARSVVSAARPGLLVPRVDPIYGTTWTRVTDSSTQIAGQPGGVNWGTGHKRHQYMRFPTWSADESLYVMTLNPGGYSGMIIHDGQVGTVLDTRSYPSGWQDYRWMNTEPASMMYCTTSALRKYLPNVGGSASDTLTKTFTPTYTNISIGFGEGEQSRDDDIWPIGATKVNVGQPDDGHEVALAYKISTNTILGEVDITALGKSASNSMVAISPFGNYIFIYYNDETTSVYQINGTLVRHVSNLQQPSHGAMAIDTNGDEMQVGSDRGSGANGEVVKIRLSDGTKTVLNDPSFAYHSSASLHLGPRANKYFVTEFYPDSSNPFVSEVVLFAMDGSALGRCGHTHKGSGSGYDFETHVSHAPFSKRLSLQTDWEGSGNVELYWVDYSAFQLTGFG